MLRSRAFSLGAVIQVGGNRRARQEACDRQLRRLVRFAAASVPYYRELFDRHGVDLGGFGGVRDLGRIPVSSRTDLQSQPLRNRIAQGFTSECLFFRSTSGSSGEPLTIGCSLFEESVLSCLRVAAWRRLGVGPRDRLMRLKIVISSRQRPGWIRRVQNRGLYREFPVDCLQPPEVILDEIFRLEPTVILSFPGILAGVAAENRGLRLPFLKKLLVGGETLTALARHQIEEGFGLPVIDMYASHEVNQIAVECPASGLMHVNDESVVLEILRDDRIARPGETGEAVVTGLHSFAMPFIRYRLGDLVTRGPDGCPCGRRGLTIERVEGRAADFIRLPDGTQVHPFAVIVRLGHDFSWIRRYRLTQEADGSLQVELEPMSRPTSGKLEALRDGILDALGRQIPVAVRTVPRIEPGPSGKYQICRSLLNRELPPPLNGGAGLT